jgi:hypothetical protein
MGTLRGIFGPSRKEIWRQLAERIGATYIEGGFWKGDKVQAHVGEWTVTLDTFTVSTGKTTVVYTRLRAPYVNADGFRFSVARKNIFTPIAKLFGMQDVEVGDAQFDDAFVIRGTDEAKLRALFANANIRRLLEAQPRVRFDVRDDEGWFAIHFPEGVDELRFYTPGVIKDVDRLVGLYELFGEVLNHLCHIGSAYERDPQLSL